MSFLELERVSRSFGGRPVLRDVSLSVGEGDFVVLIGYSGSGKTTLMNLLAGLIEPEVGQVRMNGERVTGPGPERGLMFQNYALLPWLTASENIRLAVDERHPEWSKSDRAAQVERFVRMVKLSHAAGRYPRELSGGMRQRVSLARTLAMEPRVLLLDEPLGALDALTRAQLQDEIAEIWQRERTTVVWVTNDPDEALLMGDRVVPLLPGDGEGARLGNSLEIDFPRPRDRVAIVRTSGYQELRRTLMGTLMAARSRGEEARTRAVRPDILPEDIMTVDTVRRRPFRGPRRASEKSTPLPGVSA
ncbi:MAG: ABC transporter ATP-binding protein [Verrucomicrobiales bacterium]